MLARRLLPALLAMVALAATGVAPMAGSGSTYDGVTTAGWDETAPTPWAYDGCGHTPIRLTAKLTVTGGSPGDRLEMYVVGWYGNPSGYAIAGFPLTITTWINECSSAAHVYGDRVRAAATYRLDFAWG